MDYLEDHGLEQIEWTAQLQGMNATRHIWDDLDRHVAALLAIVAPKKAKKTINGKCDEPVTVAKSFALVQLWSAASRLTWQRRKSGLPKESSYNGFLPPESSRALGRRDKRKHVPTAEESLSHRSITPPSRRLIKECSSFSTGGDLKTQSESKEARISGEIKAGNSSSFSNRER
ncbi:hypothetical protein TNCV_2607631 [Trichonephila clavipes]|uniref:Uncharacterized protein n=1 Tax=Trichonephila clavipes TaxID=2585209 RepID=A0A8X6V6X7_TRICX|nr:hypothetical protein TNCV_2607631 [Trichonephila clavipes]